MTIPYVTPGAQLRAVGYIRVSTTEQATSGGGLDAQTFAIRAEADRRGWDLVEIVGEDGGASSATLDRPGLTRALDRLDSGDAHLLIVAKLDRLSRSVIQGSQVIDRARRRGWGLVALDFGLDTSTPAGEMVASVILSASQYERRMIGVRTRDALAAKRAAGVRLGRPQALPIEVVRDIVQRKRGGQSLAAIARDLTEAGTPTARGGDRWHASTIRAVLESQAGQAVRTALP